MSIIDSISSDKQSVLDAQAALDTANAKLADDEAKLAAVQPQLDLLDQLATSLGVPTSTNSEFAPFIDGIRSLLLG